MNGILQNTRGELFAFTPPLREHEIASGISKSRTANTSGNDWKNMGMIWLSVSIPRKPLNAFGPLLFLSDDVFRVCSVVGIFRRYDYFK